MKRLSIAALLIVAAMMCFGALTSTAVAGDKPYKLDVCAMPEHETFMFWWAHEQGWDKEEGLDFNIQFFQTGMDQMEALPAKQWVIGATGGVPILVGALRYNAYMIGIGNDESIVNGIQVRPDSPILKVKGWNKDYPNVYGSPETVKGKTVLVTPASSMHYSLSEYLKVFGLTEKDVTLQNMDPAQMLAAFDSGIGDIACIWTPWLYTGLMRGNKIISTPKDVGTTLPLVLVGEKQFCDENPELVVKFLRVYFRGINMLKSEIGASGASEKLIKQYIRFFDEWAGQEWTADMAKMDLECHPIFDCDEQVAIFDESKGTSEAQKWEEGILNFFHKQGRFEDAEVQKIKSTKFVMGNFLKATQDSIKEKPLGGYTLP